jgi:hypothetical protein
MGSELDFEQGAAIEKIGLGGASDWGGSVPTRSGFYCNAGGASENLDGSFENLAGVSQITPQCDRAWYSLFVLFRLQYSIPLLRSLAQLP